MGLLRVGHDFTFTHWRRKWQPTPVFLPGESQGRGSLVGCRLWGCTESDTTSGLNCFSYDMDSTLLTCRTFQMDSNLLYLLTWHINSLACCSPWDHSQTQLSYWTTTKMTYRTEHNTSVISRHLHLPASIIWKDQIIFDKQKLQNCISTYFSDG